MSIPVQPQRANSKGMRPFHPLAEIFPLMEGEEFDQLVASVKASNGPREQIIVYEGMILDGRNRAHACEVAGIEPRYTPLRPEIDPVAFVIDKNLRRRHLNESQRGLVASRLANMVVGGKETNSANLQDCKPISRADAARLLNVSERTVASAAKVRDDASRELVAAVERGQIAVSAAEKIARLPAAAQPSAIAKALPNGARSVMSTRKHPKDDLDFSPTPPSATRALIKCVFPTMNISHASLTSVHEPACGEGHMAEVLREFFPIVTATDIHDYGYGDAVQDFLDDKFEVDADWIITNPPFNKKAEQFALKAIEQARVGVAIFARLQWLETIGRYERLFRDHPPTQIAFFCERIPLHMGRWEPNGRTATAYIWLVWVKGRAPRAPFWIPPGQRDACARHDDVERFTVSPVVKKEHCIQPATSSPIQADASSASVPSDDDGLGIPAFLRIGDPACT
jgi:hypothetical protein